MGASVADTSRLGDGFPDLVVGWRGINVLFEVKDGTKRPSEIKLTPKEAAFADAWQGLYLVVYSATEAEQLLRTFGPSREMPDESGRCLEAAQTLLAARLSR